VRVEGGKQVVDEDLEKRRVDMQEAVGAVLEDSVM